MVAKGAGPVFLRKSIVLRFSRGGWGFRLPVLPSGSAHDLMNKTYTAKEMNLKMFLLIVRSV